MPPRKRKGPTQTATSSNKAVTKQVKSLNGNDIEEETVKENVTKSSKQVDGNLLGSNEDKEPVTGKVTKAPVKRAQRKSPSDSEDEEPVKEKVAKLPAKRVNKKSLSSKEVEEPMEEKVIKKAAKRGRKKSVSEGEDEEPVEEKVIKKSVKQGRKKSVSEGEDEEPVEEKVIKKSVKRGRKKSVSEDEEPVEEKVIKKSVKRGRKKSVSEGEDDEPVEEKVIKKSVKQSRKKSLSESEDEKPVKEKGAKTTAKSRAKIPDVTALNFTSDAKSPSGKKWNIKISSWNINGIRAWLEKNGPSFISHEDPEIFCIQETKCSDDKLPAEVKNMDGYHCYWLSGDKDGYSGVGLMSKKKPKSVKYGIGHKEHDNEGRVITAEFDDFYVVNTYVPNAGRGLVRLDYRMKWDTDFRKYLKELESKKPVVLCGDLNVAHEPIDLANPKTNKRNAGFTQEERDGFTALLDEGFKDSFRYLYPEETGAYTFWTYMMNARAKNVGWRLDYFAISESMVPHLCDSVIRKDVFGSDHCPITLFLAF